MKLYSVRTDSVLVCDLKIANKPWSRIRGLLFSKPLLPDQGLALMGCNSIHSFGMKYPINVIYLNRIHQVIQIQKDFMPNRFGPIVWKAHIVIELPVTSNATQDVGIGDFLDFREE